MNQYEEDFKKIYFFKNQNQYFLPNQMFESPKWSIQELLSKKDELNRIKGLLSKYKLKVWSKHTANRDRAGFVLKKLAENVKPELLTQAWCKFYEILANFPVVPLCAVDNKKLESLHLCEAPGAFICSLNHYLVLNYPGLSWSWLANTLNPNYEGNELCEMIPDDRFIRHTLKNWIFGEDFTGDLTKPYNHQCLVNHLKNAKITLVTADGSVDCMSDPGEQEKLVERLHFCETFTALRILQTGGTFILKIFTMFEESTINILYILNCLFDKVAVFKPCTSKSGNSELYVVSTKFKGFNLIAQFWEKIWKVYEDINIFKSKTMFRLDDLPKSFLDEVQYCSDFFMKKQADTILSNIYHFEHKVQDSIYVIKSFIAQIYLSKYEIIPIPKRLRIVPEVCVTENWRIHSMKNHKDLFNINIERIKQHRKLSDVLDVVIGQEITTVHNSKFTHNDNLKKIQKIHVNKITENSLYQKILNVLEEKNNVINIKDFNCMQFSEFQREFLKKISSLVKDEKNLILINIPFVTHFLVGLLYVLFFLFDSVYMGSGILVFLHPNLQTNDQVLSIFNSITTKYMYAIRKRDGFNKDIVQIVSPDVFENGGLIEKLWNYNNNLFRQDKCFTRPFTYHL
ncbi:cap-specific mRNA (nucleoside-2'-O-)-methyltransferase 2 [Diorhabda sublineata]|uniref:cap-specific mRNA (nucleoside-2'-O-)-methyltransferase 2 n=1 Tax=Diorhabda sublineata TaxID=1163346 RepID=UPI0024E0A8A4|nr:cap-specific mRNA (nucleoside-2'-O-)-methyltransferase 2 [Diorhabda sublineata]